MRRARCSMTIAALMAMAGAVAAGPLEDGQAAYAHNDYAAALQIWRPLADQGISDAQTDLGLMYYFGQGAPQSYAEAVKWTRKAADQGNAYAQNNLGAMYEIGQGVTQDYVLAHMWVDLAAAQGLQLGSKNRDLVAAKMTPAQIAEAQGLAREWKPK